MAVLDLQVGASDGDILVWVANTSTAPHTFTGEGLTNTSHGFGEFGSFRYGSGARFLNVTIAATATIDIAYLTVNPNPTISATVVRSDIYGEDADNAAAYVDATDYNARAKTAAVLADGLGTWTLDEAINSPSLVTPVTTIKNRAGWVSGNAMAFMWEEGDADDQARRFDDSYDASTTKAPKLHIEYTAASSARPNQGSLALLHAGR